VEADLKVCKVCFETKLANILMALLSNDYSGAISKSPENRRCRECFVCLWFDS